MWYITLCVLICFIKCLAGYEEKDVPMGIVPGCDDGMTDLHVDYDGNMADFMCYEDTELYKPNPELAALIHQVLVPSNYIAKNYCMNTTIFYGTKFPTVGPHRPVWAKFGEYIYLPKQRWLNNLQRGAIVMLYHPCADAEDVRQLKDLVKNCLYKHIITPSKELSYERPLALISWGNRILFSQLDTDKATEFIKKHALHGPNNDTTNGDYDYLFKEGSDNVTPEEGGVCSYFDIGAPQITWKWE